MAKKKKKTLGGLIKSISSGVKKGIKKVGKVIAKESANARRARGGSSKSSGSKGKSTPAVQKYSQRSAQVRNAGGISSYKATQKEKKSVSKAKQTNWNNTFASRIKTPTGTTVADNMRAVGDYKRAKYGQSQSKQQQKDTRTVKDLQSWNTLSVDRQRQIGNMGEKNLNKAVNRYQNYYKVAAQQEAEKNRYKAGADPDKADSFLDVVRDKAAGKNGLIKGAGEHISEHYLKPLSKGKIGTVAMNALNDVGETTDYMALPLRALASQDNYVYGSKRLQSRKLIDGQTAWVYSGGKEKQKKLIELGAEKILNPNVRATYLEHKKEKAAIHESGLDEEFEKFAKEYKERNHKKRNFGEKLKEAATTHKNYDPDSGNKALDIVIGAAGDPTTYLGIGAVGAAAKGAKAGAKAVGKAAAKKAGKEAAEIVEKGAVKNAVKAAAETGARKAGKEAVQDISGEVAKARVAAKDATKAAKPAVTTAEGREAIRIKAKMDAGLPVTDAERKLYNDVVNRSVNAKVDKAGKEAVEDLKAERAVSRRIRTNEDVKKYMATAPKNSTKRNTIRAWKAGEKVVLTSDDEIKHFISDAIDGKVVKQAGYGIVNRRLSSDVKRIDNSIDIKDYYLELNPSDLQHGFNDHADPKQVGDLPLTKKDFEKIPEYIDTYDDILEVVHSGKFKKCVLGKRVNGYTVIVEFISDGRKALRPKTVYKMKTEKYLNKYGDQIKRNATVDAQAQRLEKSIKAPSSLDIPSNSKIPSTEGKVNPSGNFVSENKTGLDNLPGNGLQLPKLGDTSDPINSLSKEAGKVNVLDPEYAEYAAKNRVKEPVSEGSVTREVASPMESEGRTLENVGKRDVKAYQFEHPEVKPYFESEARVMLGDLRNSVRGEKSYSDALYDVDGMGYTGTKRQTTDDIAALLDGTGFNSKGYSYQEIEDALEAIIKDNGAENNAASKRVEMMLDERLRNGYTSYDGLEIPASQEYIDMLHAKGIDDYGSKVFNERVDISNSSKLDKAAAEASELEDLKKQQRELNYKLKNTQNAEHYQKYRAELDKVNERLDEIYDNQKRVAKDGADNINEPEVKQSGNPEDLPPGDGTGADIREPRDLDDLKADDNSAKITTSTEKKKDGSFKAKVDKAWQSTKRMFIDNFAAFEDIGRTLRKVDQAKGDSFMAAINALRLTRNKAGAMLKEGRINRFGKADKSLSQIFDSKEYGNLLKDKAKYEDFQYYLYHKHNIDRAREGKNVFGDVSSEESARIANELEAKYGQEFIDRADDIYSYLADLEDMRVKSGLSSAEQSAELDKIYKSYVPTYRVGDDINVSGGYDKLKDYKQYAATGGNSDIMPLHDQLTMLTNETVRESEKNLLMQAVADSQGLTVKELKDMGVKNPEKIADKLIYKSDAGNKKEVMYFVNGEAKKVTVTDEMYAGLQDWTKQDHAAIIDVIDKVTSPLNRGFKALVTDYNPIFMVRNAVRDTQEAFLYSKDTRYWVKNWPKALSAVTNKNSPYRAVYDLYIANGGKYSNLVDLETDLTKLDKAWKGKNPLERLEALNNATETLPRLSEFMGTLDKAGVLDDIAKGKVISKDLLNKAMYNANDITLNFGRSGKVTKYLNRTVAPYLNPSVQGLDKLIRTLQGDRGVKGYLGLLAKGSIFMAAPTVINSVLCKDVPGYQDINDREKENNYLIPLGDEQFIKIPKSRVGGFAGMPVRMAYESWQYGNKFDWKYLFKQSWELQGVADVSGGGLFQPIIGAATNKSWYGGQIESGEEDDGYSDVWKSAHGMSDEVYDSNTSAIGKALGKTQLAKKFGISPKKIDYALDGATGVLGDFILPATAQNSAGAPSNVLKKNFVLDSVLSNKLATNFYEKSGKLRGNMNLSESDKNKYYEFQCRYGYSASTLSQAISNIQSSEDMSKKEKAEKTRELKKAMNQIFRNERDGSKKQSDALTAIGEVIGYDNALKGYLYDPTEKDKKSTAMNHAEAYKQYRKEAGFKNMKNNEREKSARKFLKSYNKAISIQSKLTPTSSNNPDFKTLALAGAITDNKKYMDAYGVYDDKQKLARNYIKCYDSSDQAINAHVLAQKKINRGVNALKKDFPKYSTTASTQAMIIASGKYKDAQFYFNECERKMNSARGLTSEYKYSAKQFEKIRSKANTDGKNGISKAEAIAAVEKANCKDNNEAALLFDMLCSSPRTKNPYGTPKDYSLDKDNWNGEKTETRGSGGSYGRRGYSRRGHRRGGGSGSGSSKNSNLPTWEEWVKQYITTGSTSSKSSGSTAAVKTVDSYLSEAYRKKQRKLVQKSLQ